MLGLYPCLTDSLPCFGSGRCRPSRAALSPAVDGPPVASSSASSLPLNWQDWVLEHEEIPVSSKVPTPENRSRSQCTLARRNHWVLIERKTSRTISRKFRSPRKPRVSRKEKYRKTTGDTVARPCNRVARPCTRGRNHTRTAAQRSTTVPIRTATRAWTHGHAWWRTGNRASSHGRTVEIPGPAHPLLGPF
uniref:Uncharacterized protein n=1 Tax=Opuntia streptacantha TaxID=393608 RepID=A0A7C8ZP58_OPUST